MPYWSLPDIKGLTVRERQHWVRWARVKAEREAHRGNANTASR